MIDDSVEELLKSEPQWRVVDCAEPALFHTGYGPAELIAGNKANRLREAMEAELASKPGDPYACAKLGGLEVDQGNTTRGLALLEMGLEHCQSDQHRERYELLLHLGIANTSNKPEEAERYYRLAGGTLSPQVLVGAGSTGALLTPEQAGRSHRGDGVTRQLPEVMLGWYNLGLINGKPAISAGRSGLPERFAAGSQPRAASKPGCCPAGRRQL